MSADGGGTQFPYPRGSSPAQLFDALRVLVDTLNRVKSEDATDLTAINAALAQTQADLQQVIDDLASWDPEGGLTPQQAFELSLVTAVDTMMGSLSNAVLESIRHSEKAAEATIKALLAGLNNKGEIRVEQVVRKTENESFVSQLSTFNAELGNAQAAISNEIVARTNGDSALASDISTLTTTVNGNTAQIVILAGSIDGIEGKFGVAVNLNGEVVGLLQLDGTPAGSNFTVLADNFYVGKTGETGGTPVPVFTISNVGGVPKLVFRGDMFADGSITAQALDVAELSAIVANLGTITAGRMLSPLGKVDFNLDDADPYLKITSGA